MQLRNLTHNKKSHLRNCKKPLHMHILLKKEMENKYE